MNKKSNNEQSEKLDIMNKKSNNEQSEKNVQQYENDSQKFESNSPSVSDVNQADKSFNQTDSMDENGVEAVKKEHVTLPKYTKGEEIFNAVSHIVGGAFGIFALVIGIIFAALYSDGFGVAGMIVYGISLILLYTMSSIYHFLRPNKAKKVFRVFDHCAIFVLIAGTYTPICLTVLRTEGAWGWILFGLVWLFAIVGIALNATIMEKVKKISMICYIGMGWCVVIAIVPLINALAIGGLVLLVSGGLAYTIGAVIYGIAGRRGIKYLHSVWHLFILAGSLLQFLCILLYCL